MPVEKRVAITLWYLATNSDYRTIGHLFGVSKATVCIVIKEVCAAIVDVLMPRCVRIPTGHNLRTVVDGFKNDFGFRNVQVWLMVHTFQLCHLNIIWPIITIEKDGTPSFCKVR